MFDAKEQREAVLWSHSSPQVIYPRKHDAVPILPGMQAGGDDIIEVGAPFSDPVAEGPAIQEINLVSALVLHLLRSQSGIRYAPLQNGVDYMQRFSGKSKRFETRASLFWCS